MDLPLVPFFFPFTVVVVLTLGGRTAELHRRTSRAIFDNLAAMLAKIYSAAVYGVDAYEVEIEVNASGGHPVIVVVGLPDAAVKESRDREQQRVLLAARPDDDQSRAGRY